MADENTKKMHENGDSQNMKAGDVFAGALLLTGVTFASMASGFGYAIGQARRRSPSSFDQRQQEGAKLAMRALGWGTVLAVSGVGLLIFGVKTALGVKDVRIRNTSTFFVCLCVCLFVFVLWCALSLVFSHDISYFLSLAFPNLELSFRVMFYCFLISVRCSEAAGIWGLTLLVTQQRKSP